MNKPRSSCNGNLSIDNNLNPSKSFNWQAAHERHNTALIFISNMHLGIYRIAGNFRGRKLSRISRKGAFHGENFRGMLKLV